MPLLPGADAIVRLRRTIFRPPAHCAGSPSPWSGWSRCSYWSGSRARRTASCRGGPDASVTPRAGVDGSARSPWPPLRAPRRSRLPDDYVPLVLAAGKVCPEVPATRIAAQVMAASGFDPNVVRGRRPGGRAVPARTVADVRANPHRRADGPDLAVPALGRAMRAPSGTRRRSVPDRTGRVPVGTGGGERGRWVPDARACAPSPRWCRTTPPTTNGIRGWTANRPRPPAGVPRRARTPTPTTTTPTQPTHRHGPHRDQRADDPVAALPPSWVWQEPVIPADQDAPAAKSWTSDRSNSPSPATATSSCSTRTDGLARGQRQIARPSPGLPGRRHLVLYSSTNATVWSSKTAGNNGAILVLRVDGNVVITANGRTLWQTGTATEP